MAFVHEDSCECLKSDLDLFSVPSTQTSVETDNWIEYHPLTTMDDGSPIEFDISGNGEDYIDLANTMLYVGLQAKITKRNGTDLEAATVVAPVNLFLHSLFSQVDISLNGTQVTSSTNTYPYRAMLETLLSYGDDAKKSQLTPAKFYEDQPGRMDAFTIDNVDTRNSGLVERRKFTTQSKTIDMIGRIHADMFFQSRYLLNEVDVKIKLTRSRDEFCTMSAAANASKVKVVSATLFMRKVKLSPSVFLAHAKALENTTAKYPISRVVCKTLTIPTQLMDVNYEKLFSGQIPTRIVVRLVRNDAFNEHTTLNPFNFQHFNLSEISVYFNGC